MDRVQRAFSPSTGAAADARHFARTTAHQWGLSPDDVVLVVSELASNAIRHAESPFELCIERRDGAMLIEVSDNSSAPAAVRTPQVGVAGGRGLVIVDQVAREWGSRLGPHGGKTVWAEVRLK
jgi:anti-sigma regulatory factor (Ser/Thr protein kinase)